MRPNQSEFNSGRSTTDAILALRLLVEMHRAFNRPLFVAFLDLKAAFDSMDCLVLWKLLKGVGAPDVICDLIRHLYSGTTACVRVCPYRSEPFDTTSGVRQGCVIAPLLFSGPIDWIMSRRCKQS